MLRMRTPSGSRERRCHSGDNARDSQRCGSPRHGGSPSRSSPQGRCGRIASKSPPPPAAFGTRQTTSRRIPVDTHADDRKGCGHGQSDGHDTRRRFRSASPQVMPAPCIRPPRPPRCASPRTASQGSKRGGSGRHASFADDVGGDDASEQQRSEVFQHQHQHGGAAGTGETPSTWSFAAARPQQYKPTSTSQRALSGGYPTVAKNSNCPPVAATPPQQLWDPAPAPSVTSAPQPSRAPVLSALSLGGVALSAEQCWQWHQPSGASAISSSASTVGGSITAPPGQHGSAAPSPAVTRVSSSATAPSSAGTLTPGYPGAPMLTPRRVVAVSVAVPSSGKGPSANLGVNVEVGCFHAPQYAQAMPLCTSGQSSAPTPPPTSLAGGCQFSSGHISARPVAIAPRTAAEATAFLRST